MVRRNTDRIRDLVLDMLFYAKPRKPEYQSVDVNKIVQEICELLENKAKEKEVKLEWIPASPSKEVSVDPKGIYRCLLNLVSNALDACETGDKVTVRVEIAEEKGFLYIAVSDTGYGIPEDKLEDIFTPFKSSKGYGGTGLGLAVAHKIVSEHNGTISVESEVGKGTTFLVSIPLELKQDLPQEKKDD
ncbi:MAG: HAMP domain-containing histidine kinase [Caldiserica bacterium]|nr:HAMP domain-containing histidine kinase [Caldisericota bacterium]